MEPAAEQRGRHGEQVSEPPASISVKAVFRVLFSLTEV